MKKNIKFGALVGICCLIFIIIRFISPIKLYGKWYLYNGIDINTDTNIAKHLNINDYMEISPGIMKTFRSDGKDGVSECRVRGSKIHSGDAIYKYEINNIGEHKILVLKLIGYDNCHSRKFVTNGNTYTYVFDKNINIQ